MLIHHADAIVVGIFWTLDGTGCAVNLDFAGGWLIEAHDALNGGAFACAIFAEEGVDGAGFEGEGDLVEGGEGAEVFGHVDHV